MAVIGKGVRETGQGRFEHPLIDRIIKPLYRFVLIPDYRLISRCTICIF